MSETPFILFYTSDFLAGTSGMTASAKGVYITLLCLMYESEAPLAQSWDTLARRCGCTFPAFKKAIDSLKDDGKIVLLDGGIWSSKCEKHITQRRERQKSAKAAAKKRWEKDEQKQCELDATASFGQCKPEPEPEYILEPKGSLSLPVEATPPKPKGKRKAYPEDFDAFWKAYPTDPNMAKAEAFKAWQKLDANDREKALAAVQPFKAWIAKQRDYRTLHAVRFLSQRRFEGFAEQAGPQLVYDADDLDTIAVHDEPLVFDAAISWATQHRPHAIRPGQEFIKIPSMVAANLRKHVRAAS